MYLFHNEDYEKVIIGKGITSIGANAFAKSNATEIKIPQSVTSIEGGVFSSSKFRNITIPSSVTDFQARFTYMSNLESLTFEGAVPDLSFGRFEGTGQNVTINYTGGSQVRERMQEMMQTAKIDSELPVTDLEDQIRDEYISIISSSVK